MPKFYEIFSPNTAVWGLAACGAVLLWIRSGRSPLVWIAWLAFHAEAVRVQTLASIRVAARDFRNSYPKCAEEVRAESLKGLN